MQTSKASVTVAAIQDRFIQKTMSVRYTEERQMDE